MGLDKISLQNVGCVGKVVPLSVDHKVVVSSPCIAGQQGPVFYLCVCVCVCVWAGDRMVMVAGMDCMCGGTHVKNTRDIKQVTATKIKKVIPNLSHWWVWLCPNVYSAWELYLT